jgi:hypothetical protein
VVAGDLGEAEASEGALVGRRHLEIGGADAVAPAAVRDVAPGEIRDGRSAGRQDDAVSPWVVAGERAAPDDPRGENTMACVLEPKAGVPVDEAGVPGDVPEDDVQLDATGRAVAPCEVDVQARRVAARNRRGERQDGQDQRHAAPETSRFCPALAPVERTRAAEKTMTASGLIGLRNSTTSVGRGLTRAPHVFFGQELFAVSDGVGQVAGRIR